MVQFESGRTTTSSRRRNAAGFLSIYSSKADFIEFLNMLKRTCRPGAFLASSYLWREETGEGEIERGFCLEKWLWRLKVINGSTRLLSVW